MCCDTRVTGPKRTILLRFVPDLTTVHIIGFTRASWDSAASIAIAGRTGYRMPSGSLHDSLIAESFERVTVRVMFRRAIYDAWHVQMFRETTNGLPFTIRWDMGMFRNNSDTWLEFGMACFLMAQVCSRACSLCSLLSLVKLVCLPIDFCVDF